MIVRIGGHGKPEKVTEGADVSSTEQSALELGSEWGSTRESLSSQVKCIPVAGLLGSSHEPRTSSKAAITLPCYPVLAGWNFSQISKIAENHVIYHHHNSPAVLLLFLMAGVPRPIARL